MGFGHRNQSDRLPPDRKITTMLLNRRRMREVIATTVLALGSAFICGCGGGGHAAASSARPRQLLVGVSFDGPAVDPSVNIARQLDLAVASGAESLRVTADWSRMQPVRSFDQIPAPFRPAFTEAGGAPTLFGQFDRLVAAAAQRHLSLLPVVTGTPRWAAALSPAASPSAPPSPSAYAAFLTVLVHRYGPRGTFWSSHPQLPVVPIRMWQLWNEPHFVRYWSQQPFAPGYIRVMAVAHAAIKRADPGAQVVLAGLADYSWQYLADIYAVPGAGRTFDVVAIHPYTARPTGVIEILRRVRAVMDRSGDSRKPILATEITWPSSQGKAPPQFGVGTTEAMQAQLLSQEFPLLERNRARLGLSGFFWYTWMGNEGPGAKYGFDYAGLLKYVNGRAEAKPALAAFKRAALALEHCTSKHLADSCG